MRSHNGCRRRLQVLAAASAVLTSSMALITTAVTTTPATASAVEDCPVDGARWYVAQGDGVPAGEDVSSGTEYPRKLWADHLQKIPGTTGSAPWCLKNTAANGATTDSFVQGSGSQQSQAWNYKPSLITLQLGRQNSRIIDQIDSCYKEIKIFEMFPKAATCAKAILDDTAAWSKLQRDLSGILNTYKTQMSGNPNLVVSVLGYFNPYPSYLKILPKIPRLCLPTVDAAAICMGWWYGGMIPTLQRLDQVVKKLNDTIRPVVQQFTIASQGRFFFVNPYDKFKRHCMQMWVMLGLPLVLHPLWVDSHPPRPPGTNVGCNPISSWIASDGASGFFLPFHYLIPLTPPGIWLAPPVQSTFQMGVNPNDNGHGCLSDLVWETVKNKLGVPEKADINGACSRFADAGDLADPILNPGPGDNGEQNPNPPVPPASAVQGHVAAGAAHSCSVLAAGSVQCWGKNDSGQLGNGSLASSADPVTVSNIANATQIASGDNHTCAVLGPDGKVWCWGSNTSGQLGAGGTTNSTTPVQVSGLTGVKAVTAGGAFTCAILADSTVKCWGDNSTGQIDGSSVNRAVPTTVTGITKPVVAISAGDFHTCAQLADGTVTCWGANGSGQLGNGKASESPSTPAPVQGLPDPATNPTVGLAAGAGHTCALLKDNSARCWGANDSGQLGFAPSQTNAEEDPDQSGPGAVQYDPDASDAEDLHTLFGITALAAGSNHTCGLMTDGSARCWGANFSGQLGNNSHPGHDHLHDSSSAVVVTGLTGASALAAGSFHNCAIVGTGVKCWGYQSEVPIGPQSSTPISVEGTGGAEVVTAGTGSVCALVDANVANDLAPGTNNKPMCWGDNSHGQVGAGAPAGDSTIRAVSGISSADAIDAGNGQACAVPAGTSSVQCWGQNTDGQVGNGTTADQFSPVRVPGSVTTAISAGGGLDTAERGHTCAVRPDGTVGCWGRNADSQLGDGTTTDRSSPMTVQIDTNADPNVVELAPLTNVTSVATGGFHSCALTSDKTVWCWGRNNHGQLGDNSTERRSVATQVRTNADPTLDHPLGNVVALTAGSDFTCAVLGTGGAACWGASGHGQLGVGPTLGLDARLPVAVQGLAAPVTSISAGDAHVCVTLDSTPDNAVTDNDRLVCWGGNASGQLGDGTTTDSPLPKVIFDTPAHVDPPAQDAEPPIIRSLSASRANTCVTRFDLRVTCWGDNHHGQLGRSRPGSTVTPVTVPLAGPV